MILANCAGVFRSLFRLHRFPTLYIRVPLFFSKAVWVLLCRFVPAIRFTPLHSVPAPIRFILQGFPKF